MDQRQTWIKDNHGPETNMDQNKYGPKTNMDQRQTWTKDKHEPKTNMDQKTNMNQRQT